MRIVVSPRDFSFKECPVERTEAVLLGVQCLRGNSFDNAQYTVLVRFHLVHLCARFTVGLEGDSQSLNVDGALDRNISVDEGKCGVCVFLVRFSGSFDHVRGFLS